MTTEDEMADLGGGVRLIGRWHNLAEFSGVAIYESDDPVAMANWALNWNSILDCEVSPVMDDDETRAVGQMRTMAEN